MFWFQLALALGLLFGAGHALYSGTVRVQLATFSRATSPKMFWLFVLLYVLWAGAMGFCAFDYRP